MQAKNYPNVLQILILKYRSGPQKLPGLSRSGPQESYHKSVKYDRPGEVPEKDNCLWWLSRQPERKLTSESSATQKSKQYPIQIIHMPPSTGQCSEINYLCTSTVYMYFVVFTFTLISFVLLLTVFGNQGGFFPTQGVWSHKLLL